MGKKNKYNLSDNEVQQWRAFETPDGQSNCLKHLDAEIVEYQDDKMTSIQYKFYVTYSHHCFTKDDESLTEIELEQLLYPSPKDQRPFHELRYRLSLYLPEIIKTLPERFVFHGGYDKYCSVSITDENGVHYDYQIVFSVFRSQKKLRLHIESAYPLDAPPGKKKKVGFLKIAWALLKNKPLPKPDNR